MPRGLILLFLLSILPSNYSMVFGRPFRTRIVSYNVLSPYLASPTHFTTLNPDHLVASARLGVVLSKLEEEVKSNAIICLQEVSQDWAGDFHTFFANRGYHMAGGLYGKKFNGYMGVCLAWPVSTLETIHVDISRLSDKKEGGWPREDDKGALSQLVDGVWSLVARPMRQWGLVKEEVTDHWVVSRNRFNILITATLKDKSTGQAFCVGTYHMPCAYYAPMIMTIHSDLALRHVQRIAHEQGDLPYVLGGDFNIKPSDAMYRMLTGGGLDRVDPCYPTPKNSFEWAPTARPVRSAYAVAGGEPDFTNFARVREEEPFVDTLDYIFISDAWTVDKVLELPKRETAQGPFPNLDVNEPSDHVLIAADLSIKN